MVKGISRRIVVVDSPDQRFFEQAIFVVRNDAAGEGVTSQELVGWLGWLAGLQDTPKSATPGQLISRFQWSKVPKTSIVVCST